MAASLTGSTVVVAGGMVDVVAIELVDGVTVGTGVGSGADTVRDGGVSLGDLSDSPAHTAITAATATSAATDATSNNAGRNVWRRRSFATVSISVDRVAGTSPARRSAADDRAVSSSPASSCINRARNAPSGSARSFGE